MRAVGRQVELENFDGDEAFPLRVVRAKHRSQGPCTNLMKNTKRSERVGRRSSGSFRVQQLTPWKEGRLTNRSIIRRFGHELIWSLTVRAAL
jgi:hypothetical protein